MFSFHDRLVSCTPWTFFSGNPTRVIPSKDSPTSEILVLAVINIREGVAKLAKASCFGTSNNIGGLFAKNSPDVISTIAES